MKSKFLVTIIFLGLSYCSSSQSQKNKTSISGRINLDDRFEVVLINKEKKAGEDQNLYFPISKQGYFSFKLHLKKPEFWNLVIMPKAKDRQLAINFPLYLKPGISEKMHIHYNDTTYLTIKDDSRLSGGNRSLISYSNFRSVMQRKMFFQPPIYDSIKEYLMQFPNTSQNLLSRFGVKDQPVINYLRASALNDYLQNLQNLQMQFANKGINELPTDVYAFPKFSHKLWDQKEALLLNETVTSIKYYLSITDTLNSKKERSAFDLLKYKLDLFNQLFSSEKLKNNFNTALLQEYFRQVKFDSETDFEDKLKQFTSLTSLVSDTAKRNGLVRDFSNLKYTRIGAPMPNVSFKDVDGKEINLQSFKGKYVYIDMWASWCVPCIKEIPNLKQLEKDYDEKNIVFVSISVDEDKDAWKKKMKELNLSGIQLEVGDSGFEKMMNMQGIPHFILYSPEGKLMMYKAPRPGTVDIRKIFDSI